MKNYYEKEAKGYVEGNYPDEKIIESAEELGLVKKILEKQTNRMLLGYIAFLVVIGLAATVFLFMVVSTKLNFHDIVGQAIIFAMSELLIIGVTASGVSKVMELYKTLLEMYRSIKIGMINPVASAMKKYSDFL